MARQDLDLLAENAFVKKVRLLGNETNRKRIKQLRVDNRIEINPEKRRVDQRTLDCFEAEQDIRAGHRAAILKARVRSNLERVGKLVL